MNVVRRCLAGEDIYNDISTISLRVSGKAENVVTMVIKISRVYYLRDKYGNFSLVQVHS